MAGQRVVARMAAGRQRCGWLYQHVGRIDGFLSFDGIRPASGERIIILANSESTDVLAISTALAGLSFDP